VDHEPGERDPNSPFEGVVTSEPSTPWRKALAAQEAGAAAVLFVSDVHNHPGAANFEAAARNYWPEKPPRILSYTLASWADRIRIPVAQISPALAASMVDWGEAAGAGALVSAALWPRRHRPRSVRISPTVTRRERAFMALQVGRKARAASRPCSAATPVMR